MGQDARTDRDSDFVKFREENRGRLSHLRGGRSFDNAMIMQINDYIFVEFSGTGNAMYAYRIGEAPFNPESGSLEINVHLKAGALHPAITACSSGLWIQQRSHHRLDAEIR